MPFGFIKDILNGFCGQRLVAAQRKNQKYPRVGMGFSREVLMKRLSVSYIYSFGGKPHMLFWWEALSGMRIG